MIIAVFAGACWCDVYWPLAGRGGLWLLPLALLVAALASAEIAPLVFHSLSRWQLWALGLGNVLIVAAGAMPMYDDRFAADSAIGRLGWAWLAFTAAMAVAFAEQMRTYRSGEPAISRIGRTVLALAYVGGLMSFIAALRGYGESSVGLLALLSMITAVKMADIGAYAVGRLFGGRIFGTRMAPVLSPKKTFEGACGGIIGACLGSWLTLAVIGPRLTEGYSAPVWWAWLTYGVAIALSGMFGDLAESLLKREAGAKDSSTWLPGLGGVLDLMDSILFAAPVAYLIWATGVLG